MKPISARLEKKARRGGSSPARRGGGSFIAKSSLRREAVGRVLELWTAPSSPRSCPGDTISLQHMRSMVEGARVRAASESGPPPPRPNGRGPPPRSGEELRAATTPDPPQLSPWPAPDARVARRG